jgi:uncharacterized protein (DUF1800 family)
MPETLEIGAELKKIDPQWAWAALRPTAAQPWSLEQAAHLYRRAAFAANWSELTQARERGCEATVELLLEGGPDQGLFYDEARSTAEALSGSNNRQDLPAWWLHLMLHTPHPLREKLTLFWHGHFATSAAKVNDARLMYRQNELLRKYALGSFRPLLAEMARDPAMLYWLDSTTNRKLHPNENFAREVMELFSLGLGHYSEDDIQQAARAFTGWEVRYATFRFNRHQHDAGTKVVLGQRGTFDGEDLIGILLNQPAASRFLVGKLYRYLVSDEDPPERLLDPLVAGYRSHDYDTRWLVGTILRSNFFYGPHAMRRQIKPPVDFAIGLVRALEGTTNAYALAGDLVDLGQAVFYPPNVKGWDGGLSWINASTLLCRANLAWALVGGVDSRYVDRVQLEKLAALEGQTKPAQAARRLADLLIAGPLPDETYVQLTTLATGQDRSESLARVVQAIATLPEFQLA